MSLDRRFARVRVPSRHFQLSANLRVNRRSASSGFPGPIDVVLSDTACAYQPRLCIRALIVLSYRPEKTTLPSERVPGANKSLESRDRSRWAG